MASIAPQAKQSETLESSQSDPGRIFKTVKGQVGPFPHREGFPHIFSEAEFVRVHPIPEKSLKSGSIDASTYHQDLITRLVMIGSIVEAPGEKAMETPNTVPAGMKNHGILSAAKNVLDARKVMDNQKAEDLRRLTDAKKN